jgi:hypothetical protein
MKAMEKLASLAKERFNSTDAKIDSNKAEYLANNNAWKIEKDGELSTYSADYDSDMEARYGEEAADLASYEATVTTGVDNLIDKPDFDNDLAGIAAELASDKAEVNAAVAASIDAEEVARDTFIAEFGEVAEFQVEVDHAYTVTGI